MSSLMRRDYWREMNPMRESINSFIDDLFTRLPGISGWEEWRPSIDLIDKGTDYIIMADLPGYTPENVKITVQENSVQIRGKVQEEKDTTQGDFQVKERSFGTFSRSIPLPAQIKPEEARAKFKNGVLEITLPKVDVPAGRILDIETE
ncbi:MAG: Hsp20/alpha crystallin family protein [Syntrophaceticus sp.]